VKGTYSGDMNEELHMNSVEASIVRHPRKQNFVDTDLFVVFVLLGSLVLGVVFGVLFALS
jgi:hypothetical protein